MPYPELTTGRPGAKTTPFFTPAQDPPAGTPRHPATAPVLFQPLKLRGLTLHNRIIVSPMCQYSADDGHFTAWHKQHLGHLASRGPSLVITEVLATSPEGRISPQDAGIWSDSHLGPLKEVVEYAHSQNSKIAFQIGHAGRKASTYAPWQFRGRSATDEHFGWAKDVIGPSEEPYSDDSAKPREMTLDDIEKFKKEWAAAVKRAISIGVDAINIHAAHGYLLSEFLSPASNHRTDKYGGSFENRIRLLLELVEITRSIVPETFPLMVRVNGTDYLSYDESLPQWHIEEAAKLGKLLSDAGIDLIDVSGGGNDSRQKITPGKGYQVPLAAKIKEAVKGTKTYVSAVGSIESGKQANGYVETGEVDAVMVARGFLDDPNLVIHWAKELEVPVYVAAQYGWPTKNNRDYSATAEHGDQSNKETETNFV